ncbi:cytochrome b5-like heme/steroid binding domain-containing protein [Halteromyces radiatus]|uniref:cytochrome b5-like heme/steroid binding domain-containing protein n=1 Tax=Halteromyces radiatus TaxID=101107 RepID=UPI00221F06C8|nr:cytochrome b5-like heme/steroid binding domain-containing protein [Halteromyces radiatus]KAI8096935.1 cytochrome b5-like heme/steroid binding domain-containing protein [Halteromyces radiatus]
MSKVYTYEEVAQHNKREDLWMIIDKKVYDITGFVDEHPGGEEVLIDEGARDATGPFEDVGHSPDARELLVKYYIGDVDPTSAPVKVTSPNATSVPGEQVQGNPLRIIIPLLIVLGYIYFRFYA